jgi:predicted nicotinamide N-methyase
LPPAAARRTRVARLDWARRDTWPLDEGLFDVVFGSDLVYDAAVSPLLASAVAGLCKPAGHFLCVLNVRRSNARNGCRLS